MKYFIAGVLFALIGMPVIDFLTTWLANFSELHSYKIAKKVYDIQKTMTPLQENDSNQEEKFPMGFATSCVGFEVDNQEEYEEEQENCK